MIFYKFGFYPYYIFWFLVWFRFDFEFCFFGLRNIVLVWLFMNLDLEKKIGLVWFKYIGCHIKLYGVSILLKWNYFE